MHCAKEINDKLRNVWNNRDYLNFFCILCYVIYKELSCFFNDKIQNVGSNHYYADIFCILCYVIYKGLPCFSILDYIKLILMTHLPKLTFVFYRPYRAWVIICYFNSMIDIIFVSSPLKYRFNFKLVFSFFGLVYRNFKLSYLKIKLQFLNFWLTYRYFVLPFQCFRSMYWHFGLMFWICPISSFIENTSVSIYLFSYLIYFTNIL